MKTEMNHEFADQALVLFSEVAKMMDLDWCLYAGTALGLYRDGKYLPEDNDIDLAVKPKIGQLNELWSALHQAGFKLGDSYELTDSSRNRHVYFHPVVRHPTEGGVLVDVFYSFPEDEENLMTQFDGIYYKNELYLTPHPLPLYLQSAYGEWWDKTLRNSASGKEYVRTL